MLQLGTNRFKGIMDIKPHGVDCYGNTQGLHNVKVTEKSHSYKLYVMVCLHRRYFSHGFQLSISHV